MANRVFVSALSILVLGAALNGCSGNPTPIAPTQPSPITPLTTTKGKFVYTGNQGQSLSGYSVNTSTGGLTPIAGIPTAFGLNPTVVTHDAQNRFLIVADIAADQVHVLAINSSSGALTEVSPSPYKSPVREPVSVIVDPTGTHVYLAAQYATAVAAFALSPQGLLTPVPGSPFSTGGPGPVYSIGSNSLAINAAGTVLYSQDVYNTYVFAVTASSGALTLKQTLPGPVSAFGLALDPAGTYLYAVGSGSNPGISAYAIDPTTGLLTASKSSALSSPNGAYTIAISPTGQSAYTIEDNNYLVSYRLNNGSFTQVGTIYKGVLGLQIGIDPSGAFVYVPYACSAPCSVGAGNIVNQFAIGTTGALTPQAVPSVPSGIAPFGITITSQ